MAIGEAELERLYEQLDTALARLAEIVPTDIDPLVLVDGVGQLLDRETKLRAIQATWLARADRIDAAVAAVGRSTSAWLTEELHLNRADAARRLRLARSIDERPEIHRAVSDARITPEQADTILAGSRGLDEQAGSAVAADLIEKAAALSTIELARAVDDSRRRLAGETQEEQARRHHDQRAIQIDEQPGGVARLTGTLTTECREALGLAMRAAGGEGLPDAADPRPIGQRRHDALHDIATFYIQHYSRAEPEAGERPRIVVTVAYETLMNLTADDFDLGGRYDSGAPLTVGAIRRMACDAMILPAVLGGRSEVLDLGRLNRTFSLGIKRAARLRDGARCARHGCSRRIVECHHIVWWSAGGRTSLENAAWLCSFHHWLVHEGGWSMRRLGPGRYVFNDPQGREHGPPPETGPPARSQAA